MPHVQFGKYQLLRKLAAGGMAELFLARREGPMKFSKQVVIKRILPEFSEDPEFVRTFLNEARLAALLNHPSVVHVYELGQIEGQYYIEMEFIEGENLQRLAQLRSKQQQRFSPREAASVLAHVAEGLAHAHALKTPRRHPAAVGSSRRQPRQHSGERRRQREAGGLWNREGGGADQQDPRRCDQGQGRLPLA